LHVSGSDPDELEHAIAEFQRPPYDWQRVQPDLEDVFIHLMGGSQETAA
jgi:ABC-2 type transport system ATP-binding protein